MKELTFKEAIEELIEAEKDVGELHQQESQFSPNLSGAMAQKIIRLKAQYPAAAFYVGQADAIARRRLDNGDPVDEVEKDFLERKLGRD